ncbi:guanitoxin biosynthesis heme-dependent pre-guanitoxin N-hydroxylase GntA [Kaistella sp.]|uniref:guanitoxin biosynthesis heme-dependent pre-guanitoxin N-hydroxylase GntA n=1 Tax=Kaistella sp. TaxID=2782235 RepID=UPI00359F6A19
MNTTVRTGSKVHSIEEDYKNFILNEEHPCIMAKSIFKMEKYHLNVYDDMFDKKIHHKILTDLKNYIYQYDFNGNQFESFIAVFPNNKFANESDFEDALWNTLQSLHEVDDRNWDSTVSDDGESPEFSFSLGGKAFYIIGLHPESSRMARQAPYTTLVFNLHHQFEKLREMGTYHAVRDTIRKNDAALQGHINPVLEDYGEDTEAKQYSGRKVEENWKCPFHKKSN